MSKPSRSPLLGVLGLVGLVLVAFLSSVALGIVAGFVTHTTTKAPAPQVEIIKYYGPPPTALRGGTAPASPQ